MGGEERATAPGQEETSMTRVHHSVNRRMALHRSPLLAPNSIPSILSTRLDGQPPTSDAINAPRGAYIRGLFTSSQRCGGGIACSTYSNWQCRRFVARVSAAAVLAADAFPIANRHSQICQECAQLRPVIQTSSNLDL